MTEGAGGFPGALLPARPSITLGLVLTFCCILALAEHIRLQHVLAPGTPVGGWTGPRWHQVEAPTTVCRLPLSGVAPAGAHLFSVSWCGAQVLPSQVQ